MNRSISSLLSAYIPISPMLPKTEAIHVIANMVYAASLTALVRFVFGTRKSHLDDRNRSLVGHSHQTNVSITSMLPNHINGYRHFRAWRFMTLCVCALGGLLSLLLFLGRIALNCGRNNTYETIGYNGKHGTKLVLFYYDHMHSFSSHLMMVSGFSLWTSKCFAVDHILVNDINFNIPSLFFLPIFCCFFGNSFCSASERKQITFGWTCAGIEPIARWKATKKSNGR